MKTSRVVLWLSAWLLPLAVAAAGTGLLWDDGGHPFSFTTLRGESIQLYGRGLYRHDSLLIGAGFRGTDAVTLFICVPLLTLSLLLYRRGSLRGGLLLTGLLSYFLYNSASLALGAAYNPLFLLYVAELSLSFFAFVSVSRSFDLPSLPRHFSERLPRRGIAIFLLVAGGVLALVWLSDIVGALLQGRAPAALASYTTSVTHALDLAIIAPAAVLAGVLLLRRAPLGYLLAAPLLVLNTLIGVVILAQTWMQLRAGVPLSPGEFLVFGGSFLALTVVAAFFTAAFFRNASAQH